ncbi:MAG: methionyl-tRNA formyltransferase, partial [Patescibacteria group bacterium]
MPCNSRFIFFGTPEFAAVILEKLIKNGFVPAAVVCNPDRPVGRKKIVAPPPVKTKIMNYEARI